MNPVEQRIAIALTQGFIKVSEIWYSKKTRTKWASPLRYFLKSKKLSWPEQQLGWEVSVPEWNKGAEPNWDRGSQVPDYPSSLDEMNKVEMTLNRGERSKFRQFLGNQFECDEDGDSTGWEGKFGRAIHASAKQRAEAFLRAKNLWKD